MLAEKYISHQYILKPMEISKTVDAENLLKDILSDTKLHICIGNHLVGKTAMSFKLLHCLLSNTELNTIFKPLIVRLQEKSTYNYWQDQIQVQITNVMMQHKMMNIPFMNLPYTDYEIMEILKSTISLEELLIANKYNFIIFDGFNFFDEERIQIRARYLAKLIHRITRKHNVHILVNVGKENEACLDILKLNNEFNKWNLSRPEYINEACREFGDSVVELM